MMGAHLRISDVETCNTSVFCGFIVCWNKLYRQIYNSLEVLSIFVLGKRSPRYLPEDFTEMAFVGKTPKARQSSPLYNPDVSPFALWRILPVYCSPNV